MYKYFGRMQMMNAAWNSQQYQAMNLLRMSQQGFATTPNVIVDSSKNKY